MAALKYSLSIVRTKSYHRCFAQTVSHRTFSKNILDSGVPDIDIPKISIPEKVQAKWHQFEHLVAAECAETGRKYTYSELRKKSNNFGKSLRKKLKLEEGDVVAVLLPNVPEYAIVILGILQAGLIITTLNPVYTAEEISRQLSDSNAQVVITLNDLWGVVNSSRNMLKRQIPIIAIKTQQEESLHREAIDFTEFSNTPIDLPDFQPRKIDDVAFMPYSSGTTGLPKGVLLTNYNIVASLSQNLSPDTDILQETTANHQDIVPGVLPMFHIYGFNLNTLCILTMGAKLITLPKFIPELYISVLKDHKPHVLFTVPPMVLFMSTHPAVKTAYLNSIRTVFCGAAPLGSLDEAKFLEKAGRKNINLFQGYGLTESSPTVTALTESIKAKVKSTSGSVGRPCVNTLVKIVSVDDPKGEPLGPNTSGELYVKGPQVMKGYHRQPEQTAATIVDGWLKTGDLGHYNEDKLIFVTDRLKELIKVKGFQVAPAELEEVLRDHPDVEDAAVIGVEDPKLGEVPKAYIVGKKNHTVIANDLLEFVAKRVAKYKNIKGGIEVVDSIPKNASGKILRRQLKMMHEKSKRSS